MGVTIGPVRTTTGSTRVCGGMGGGLVQARQEVGDEALLDAARVEVEDEHGIGADGGLHVGQAHYDRPWPRDDGRDLGTPGKGTLRGTIKEGHHRPRVHQGNQQAGVHQGHHRARVHHGHQSSRAPLLRLMTASWWCAGKENGIE